MGMSKLAQFISYRVRITLVDGRMILGTFLAFDKHMNMVIGDGEEYRPRKKKSAADADKEMANNAEEDKRTLGLVILRGENIVSLNVEGPPINDERRGMPKTQMFIPGPGNAVVGGRAMPTAPSGPVPGLSGAPLPGVGAPVNMVPRGQPGMDSGQMPAPGMMPQQPMMGRGFPPPMQMPMGQPMGQPGAPMGQMGFMPPAMMGRGGPAPSMPPGTMPPDNSRS